MTTSRRLTVSIILLILSFAIAAPAFATEETEDPEPVPISEEEGAEAVPIDAGVEPAVVVTTPPASDATLDWTYRYIIPTALVIAVLVIVITCIQYFTRVVRKRYRILEE